MALVNIDDLMRNIESRYSSYATWTNASVDSRTLARAGFYYLGNGRTRCAFCKVIVSEWNAGEEAILMHLAVSPQCPFLRDLPNYALTEDHVVPFASSRNDMKTVEERLESFNNWPNPDVNVGDLSRAGFYHDGGERVRCPYCDDTLNGITENDHPFLVHIEESPDCPFTFRPIDQLWAGQNARETEISKDSFKERMKIFTERVATFIDWTDRSINTVELAKAGFFSLHYEDFTRCGFCSGVVSIWSPGEVPMTTHVRLFPSCPYVLVPRDVEEEVAPVVPLRVRMRQLDARISTFFDWTRRDIDVQALA